MPNEQGVDEKGALKELQSQFQTLAKPLESVAKVSLSDPEALTKLDAALKALPTGEQWSRALTEISEKAAQFITEARSTRARSFGRIETAFIKAMEAEGQSHRELDSAWRVGGLEFQVDREQAKARVRVNREELVGWTAIKCPEDLHALQAKARALLQKAAISEELLADLMRDAYEQACNQRKLMGAPTPQRVPVRQLYQEVLVNLVRREFAASKGTPKLSKIELPQWAFLYNLDRYRMIAAGLPTEKRLMFETGSQKEVQQGMGLVVNGLDARRDYEVICHVVAVKG